MNVTHLFPELLRIIIFNLDLPSYIAAISSHSVFRNCLTSTDKERILASFIVSSIKNKKINGHFYRETFKQYTNGAKHGLYVKTKNDTIIERGYYSFGKKTGEWFEDYKIIKY